MRMRRFMTQSLKEMWKTYYFGKNKRTLTCSFLKKTIFLPNYNFFHIILFLITKKFIFLKQNKVLEPRTAPWCHQGPGLLPSSCSLSLESGFRSAPRGQDAGGDSGALTVLQKDKGAETTGEMDTPAELRLLLVWVILLYFILMALNFRSFYFIAIIKQIFFFDLFNVFFALFCFLVSNYSWHSI